MMASTTTATRSDGTATSIRILGQEVHGVFGAAIDFGVPLLTAVALDLAGGHPVHANRDQGVADLVELEWLDDGNDEFHASPLSCADHIGVTLKN